MAHWSHESLGRLAYITVQLCVDWEKSLRQRNGSEDAALKPMLKTTFGTYQDLEISYVVMKLINNTSIAYSFPLFSTPSAL